MRCIFCGKPADEVGERDWDGTVTRCSSGHKVRFITVPAERVAMLNDEERAELALVAHHHLQPDGSFDVPSERFKALVAFAATKS
jgi:hypothetical protein